MTWLTSMLLVRVSQASQYSLVQTPQNSVPLTQKHDGVDKVHPVKWQWAQGIQQGETAHIQPIQVFSVQGAKAPFLGNVQQHQECCKGRQEKTAVRHPLRKQDTALSMPSSMLDV